MKRLILALFLLPLFTFAQDCKLKNEKDQFNQDPRLTTGFKSLGVGSNKFMLSVSADKTEIDFFIALDNSAECFNDISRAVIVFDGIKSKGNYKNGGTTNCKGYFHFIFKNQENLQSPLKNLAEKKVASIQFITTANTKKDVILRPEDQELLQQMANCVISQLAALRTDTWKVKPKQ